jgi:hypothetical protein
MVSRYATSGEHAFYIYEKNRLLSKILMATRCHWQLVYGGDAVVLSLKAINLLRLRRRRNGNGREEQTVREWAQAYADALEDLAEEGVRETKWRADARHRNQPACCGSPRVGTDESAHV